MDRGTQSTWRLAAALCVAALASAFVALLESLTHLFSVWPDFRLGFSGLIAAGLPLYPHPITGPVVGDIYGPVAALFYLPPLAIGPNITADVWLAEAWTFVVVFGVILVACMRRSRQVGRGGLVGACVAALTLPVMLALPGLSHNLVQVHADAPCLFFGVLSCLVWGRDGRFRWSRAAASALLFGLALLSKQTALFVLPGQLLVLALRFGPSRALGHALAAVAASACIFFLCAWLLGSTPAATWFYLVIVPARHLIRWSAFAAVAGRAFTFGLPFVAMSSVVVWVLGGWRALGSRELRATMPLDVLLLAASGLTLGPISFVATMKIGGYLNNLHSHYYLLFACALGLVDALRDQRLSAQAVGSRLTCALFASLLLLPNDLSHEIADGYRAWGHLRSNTHQLAYDYLAHHDDAYFPWHTLAVAQARGVSYTAFDGMRTFEQADFWVSPERLAHTTPPSPRYIVLPSEGRGTRETLNFVKARFPLYKRLNKPPKELRSFVVFEKQRQKRTATRF